MIETGSQRKYIQILTGIGFIISIALFVFFKQHPAYFQVGGLFQSYLGSLGLFAPLIFMALQVVQVSKQFQKGKQKPRYHKDSLIVKP